MEPKLISELRLKCPVCGKESLVARDYLYEAENVGKLVLSNWQCESCNYNFRDVKPYEVQEPKKIELKVERESDLNILVFRSPFATLILPELGIEIYSKDASQGLLSTVEGLLEDILDHLGNLCDENNCKDIHDAKNGKIPFTLIIEDPSGTSFVKSEKAKISQLLSLSH